ncbi:MAG: hypothetical protein KJ574_03315 [Nanoarchaeota archaeon]|nr:hypothetical protein [Nanoarchaeota archaeon]
MKLFRSKKALIFNIFVVILTIMALVYGYMMLEDKAKRVEKKLGLAPLEMFMRYQDGDKVMVFLDQAGEISLREGTYDMLEEGGVDKAKCGDYYGFGMWTTDEPGCMPNTDDIYERLTTLFTQKMASTITGYPGISFLRYYVGSPVAGTTPTMAAGEEGAAAGATSEAAGAIAAGAIPPGGITAQAPMTENSLVSGLIDIPQDDQIYCGPGAAVCKLRAELMLPLQNIKNYLEPGQKVKIVSATRTLNTQRNGFLSKYIKNGKPPVCGPTAYRTKIYDAIGPPPAPNDAAYHAKVDQYLAANPTIKDALGDIKNYQGCPHVLGLAIDIEIDDAQGHEISHDKVREIMCKADWVNYGAEWWHFEYGTGYWDKKRPDQVPDNLVGSPATNNYNANCYYGRSFNR